MRVKKLPNQVHIKIISPFSTWIEDHQQSRSHQLVQHENTWKLHGNWRVDEIEARRIRCEANKCSHRQWIENETIIYPHFASLITKIAPLSLSLPSTFFSFHFSFSSLLFAAINFTFHDILQAINSGIVHIARRRLCDDKRVKAVKFVG